MSKKPKRRPARPHFERITRRHPGGAETEVPDTPHHTWLGTIETKRESSTKRPPGQ